MKNRVCELLGIEYPIVMGGMVWIGKASFAAAVSNAGALGMVAAAHLSAEDLRQEIREVRALTQKPFGVNMPLLMPWAGDWIDVVIEERVPAVFTSAGNPQRYTQWLKDAGIAVVHVVSTARMASKAELAGVDAVVAEGFEAGGHNSFDELSTMVLVPQVVDAVKIPVIAAGGIADSRGFVAALALGAEAIQMGTRFLATVEATVHPNFKRAVLAAGETDTVVTGRRVGPVRIIKNKLARQVLELEAQGVSDAELLAFLGHGRSKLASIDGDVENGSVMSGQIAGMIQELTTVKDLVDSIIKQSTVVSERVATALVTGQ